MGRCHSRCERSIMVHTTTTTGMSATSKLSPLPVSEIRPVGIDPKALSEVCTKELSYFTNDPTCTNHVLWWMERMSRRKCLARLTLFPSRAPRFSLVTADYVCPTYKTSARKGELSTTGVSTNFVVAVEFPTNVPVRQFILHGTAMLLSLES